MKRKARPVATKPGKVSRRKALSSAAQHIAPDDRAVGEKAVDPVGEAAKDIQKDRRIVEQQNNICPTNSPSLSRTPQVQA